MISEQGPYGDFAPQPFASKHEPYAQAPQQRSTSRNRSRGRSRPSSPARTTESAPQPQQPAHHVAPSRQSSFASVHSFQQQLPPAAVLQPEPSFGRSSAAGSYAAYQPQGHHPGFVPHRAAAGGYLDSLSQRNSAPEATLGRLE